MRTREDYEKRELEFLAPYAMKSALSLGQEFLEELHPYRTRFQRDRDRIIHSNAFRRLEYKTQVFVNHEGDHFRTRLTHSLEASQIARTLARSLGLNEDLAEAIILAHDIGHPPFGHSGQVALNRLMKDHGGFEHNRQSLRIVSLLEERYPQFPGLNLTYEVREGIAKHQHPEDKPNAQVSFKKIASPSLEAQMVNIADEIAYSNHDLDDGLRSGLINLKQLEEVQLWEEHYNDAVKCFPNKSEDDKTIVRQTIRGIINTFATDLVTQTELNLKDHQIKTIEDVRAAKVKLVTLSSGFDKKNQELKAFLRDELYRNYRVERMADKADRILEELFHTYIKHPRILPHDILEKTKTIPTERVICDYIAGMTDRFALEEYRKLFDPLEKV